MGPRVRGVAVVVVVLVTGAFLGSALSQWWRAPTLTEGGLPVLPVIGAERVRVEVLNGGGKTGMARSATDQLRDRGFDVVYFGNDTVMDRDSSFVVARTNRLDWARSVADVLGIRTVRTEPDENLYLDVSVVLGAEWDPAPEEGTSPETDEAPWWDIREWMRRPGAPDPDAKLADPGTSGPDDSNQ